MLKTQVQVINRYRDTADAVHALVTPGRRNDRGEVTSQTIVIALLVAAAVAAGGIIAARIGSEASKVGG